MTQEINPSEVTTEDMPDPEKVKEVLKHLQKADKSPRNMRDVKESTAVPSWANIPSGFDPPKGVQVIFMKFKAEWTSNPNKGERQAIAWPITVQDERNALARSKGDVLRSIDELSKQMCRYIDGHQADWTGADPNTSIDQWWNEIGPKCRNLVHRVYTQTHNLNDEEHADFFENCLAVRTVG
jgi:hypothetical protein